MPVLIQLSDDEELNLPLLPLTVALAFGACLGGKYDITLLLLFNIIYNCPERKWSSKCRLSDCTTVFDNVCYLHFAETSSICGFQRARFVHVHVVRYHNWKPTVGFNTFKEVGAYSFAHVVRPIRLQHLVQFITRALLIP